MKLTLSSHLAMTKSGMYVHVEMIKHEDKIILKLELGVIGYLTTPRLVFIRRLVRSIARYSFG